MMARRNWLMSLSRVAKPLMGVTLVAIGVAVLTGLDKRLETAVTNIMPDWLVELTTRF
jgi:hypothetical protein